LNSYNPSGMGVVIFKWKRNQTPFSCGRRVGDEGF